MITGAHAILYSKDSDSDRAFLRDVLGFPHVDVGGGWLIFGLPPSEVAIHPGEDTSHELYLMTEDVDAFVAAMKARGIATGPLQNQGWGILTEITLPGGGTLGVYQPRHARPKQHGVKAAAAKKKPAPKKKPAAKKKAAPKKKAKRGKR